MFDIEPKKSKGNKQPTKMPKNGLDGNNKEPKTPKHGSESCLTARNISMFVNRIHEGISDEHILTTDIIFGTVYKHVYINNGTKHLNI
jgi:hypothetical protein